MEISDAQKRTVKQWVKEGCGLSDIQIKLLEEFKISMTYMDVRLLIVDLGINIQNKQGTKSYSSDLSQTEAQQKVSSSEIEAQNESPFPGKSAVSVEIDRVMKPHSLVSGKVLFSDGVSATWSLDALGRLALNPDKLNYHPKEEDVQAFQQEIKKALEKKGF